MFSSDFLNLSSEEIVASIKRQGYFSFEKAVSDEFLIGLQQELGTYTPSINKNEVTPVWSNNQYFFPQAFAGSQSYYDYIVSEKVLDICRSAFLQSFRLKCHRYYETSYGHSMEWHADNVTNEGDVTDTNGLIFILYVNDVFDGEFQLVERSYEDRTSGEWTYNYTNKFISETYGDQIKTFSMPAGSIIIYDTFGIHRAKPIASKGYTRKSIFFQVDSSTGNAEEIMINPAFITRINDEITRYLGFGEKQDFKSNPISNEKHVPIPVLLQFQVKLVRAILIRSIKVVLKMLTTHDQRMWIAKKFRVQL